MELVEYVYISRVEESIFLANITLHKVQTGLVGNSFTKLGTNTLLTLQHDLGRWTICPEDWQITWDFINSDNKESLHIQTDQ